MQDQANSRLKVFHNLDELEEGQEIELNLDDYQILSKARKVNGEDILLTNKQLYNNQYQKHLSDATKTLEQRALDPDFLMKDRSQRILSEYDTFDKTKNGFYMDEEENRDKQLSRIKQKLGLTKPVQVQMDDSRKVYSDVRGEQSSCLINKKRNFNKDKVQKVNFNFSMPKIEHVKGKPKEIDNKDIDSIKQKFADMRKINTVQNEMKLTASNMPIRQINDKLDNNNNNENNEEAAVDFDELEPEMHYEIIPQDMPEKRRQPDNLRSIVNGTKSILDVRLPSEMLKECDQDIIDEEIQQNLEELNKTQEKDVTPEIQNSAVGTLEYLKSKGFISNKKSDFDKFYEEKIDDRKKKDKFKEISWAFHKKQPGITKRIKKMKQMENEKKFARGGQLTKTLNAVQATNKQPYTDLSKLK